MCVCRNPLSTKIWACVFHISRVGDKKNDKRPLNILGDFVSVQYVLLHLSGFFFLPLGDWWVSSQGPFSCVCSLKGACVILPQDGWSPGWMVQSRRGWRGLGRPKLTTSACGLYWMLSLVCIVFVWQFSSTSLHINLTDAPALVTGARRTGLAVSAAGWSGPCALETPLFSSCFLRGQAF